MAVSFVRLVKSASATTAATSIPLTSLAANIPVGDTLVVALDSNLASATVVGVADNSSSPGAVNSYSVKLDSTTIISGVRVVAIVCQVTRQILTTNTITVTIPSSDYSVRVLQFTGSSGFDAASTADQALGTAVTTNNVTTVANTGMLIAFVASRQVGAGSDTGGTIGGGTATVGTTSFEGQLWNGSSNNNSAASIAEEYANFTGAGTANGTFTLPTSINHASGIISLADAAAPNPLPQSLIILRAVSRASLY